MEQCAWCGQACRDLSLIKNRDPSLFGVYVWVCDGCKEAVQDEYWCGAFCTPPGFRLSPKRPLILEAYHPAELVEGVSSPFKGEEEQKSVEPLEPTVDRLQWRFWRRRN